MDKNQVQVLNNGFWAVRLASGLRVLGKSYGEAVSYANLYQAKRALESFREANPGISAFVRARRPFYVVLEA